MKGVAKVFFVLGSLNAAVSVGLGAAGAHALKAQLSATDPGGWFAMALQYHQLHALGLILIGLASSRFPSCRAFAWAGWLMLAGMLLFSGGLYLLSLTGLRLIPGSIPAGGAAMIAAWLFMALGAWRLTATTPETQGNTLP